MWNRDVDVPTVEEMLIVASEDVSKAEDCVSSDQ